METLGKYFRQMTKPAFERYGFAQGDLLSSWAAIAGNDVAAICRPERMKWRNMPSGEKPGGTLVLRVEPGRSLDVQYRIPQLQDRINQFFGYAAVTQIKLLQAALPSASPSASKPIPAAVTNMPDVAGIEDESLRLALARLAVGVASAARSPQSK